MSLNIKNEETYALTRELAALTGESLTEAVTIAVRDRLARVRGREEHVRARADMIRRLGDEIASRLSPEALAVDHGELLYDDETGLPR